jgi:drug/metabolite transporter (DMT)-like permease
VTSLVYRFAIASALLFLWARFRGLRMQFGLKTHGFLALLGVLIFSINFLLLYLAIRHLTTGLVAVIFSTSVFMNILNAAVFLGRPIERRVMLSAMLGLMGMLVVFGPELRDVDLSGSTGLGVLLAFGATFAFSLGNIVAARNHAAGVPVLPAAAYGMAYGAIILGLVGLSSGTLLRFDWSRGYVLSLLYLAVFGSVIGYGTYLTLVGRIGAARAAYATVLAPILALVLSTIFEGFVVTPRVSLGVALILSGNVAVLGKSGTE